jgi:YVTN family beta-propeller protein
MRIKTRVFEALAVALFAIAAGAAQAAPAQGDRVYTADQFSNTVSVTDPVSNRLLGVIRLGDPQPGNFSPLYRGQVLVHGLGFSPDHHTLAVVAIGSNAVTFIDTATNTVKHTTYVGRAPHEAFFTPDGKEVWVTVRGESYIAVLDAATFAQKLRLEVPNGPGMQIFSPDGKYGYICSSFTPEMDVVTLQDHKIVARVPQASPFCPNLAVTPDGSQVWLALKDVGKVQAFGARPPFALIRTLDTGPITNHVNFAQTANGTFAYVTVGGLNMVKAIRVSDMQTVATIPVGAMPHGVWPSGDGSRVYVGLENDDAVQAIDTASNKVIATIPVGQAPQALVYVPHAAGGQGGAQNLSPLGLAGQAVHLELGAPGAHKAATSISLFDQGLVQVLQGAVTALKPKSHYALALSGKPDGSGGLQPLLDFTTNPAGAAVIDTVGPIRQVVSDGVPAAHKFIVIVEGTSAAPGAVVQTLVKR